MFRHKNCVVDQRADARFRFNSREPFPNLEKSKPVQKRWSGLPAKTIEPKSVAMVANSESFRMIVVLFRFAAEALRQSARPAGHEKYNS